MKWVVSGGSRHASSLAASLVLLLTTAALAAGQPSAANGWPREVRSGGDTLTVYQPQLDRWEGQQLSGRSAVAVETAASPTPTYGVVWFEARTSVDKAARQVTLDDFTITKVDFPSAAGKSDDFQRALRTALPTSARTISLDRLEASLEVARAEGGGGAPSVPVKNEPPRIYFSQTPAILVLVDGTPALRQVDASGDLMRVINTRALLLFDTKNATYYLYVMNRWARASAVEGPWQDAGNPPAGLEAARKTAVAQGRVDLLSDPESAAKAELERGVLPALYVSTVPAALLQSDGKPQLSPIPGTQLLEVRNSTDAIFLDVQNQHYYVLVSGRWFTSSSLTDDSWTFVAADALPDDFAKIPYRGPRGNALVSVSGTPQAREAVIASTVPQTATVQRSEAKMPPPKYDGEPAFVPIQGTALEYATNTATPVIRVSPTSYYAVVNGVWFTSASPTVGWAVATSVPPAIYTIPASSPLYYVTYVHVYGATPEVVYVGYTPGYYGTYVTPAGTVVYGTGYVYPPYVGSVWIGPPVTYGFGAGFAWGAFTGFALGVTAGAFCHPWWGPVGWGWGWGTTNVNINRNVNVYNSYSRWGKNSVAWSGNRYAGHVGNTTFAGAKGGDVYADRNGNVYRRDNGSWQKYDNGSWNDVHPKDSTQAQNAKQRVQQNGGLNRQGGGQGLGESSPGRERAGGGLGGDGSSRFSSLENDWRSRQLGQDRSEQFGNGGFSQRFGGWGGGQFGAGGDRFDGSRFGGGFSRGFGGGGGRRR